MVFFIKDLSTAHGAHTTLDTIQRPMSTYSDSDRLKGLALHSHNIAGLMMDSLKKLLSLTKPGTHITHNATQPPIVQSAIQECYSSSP